MKKTKGLFMVGAVIAIAALIFWATQAMAAEAQLIKIQPDVTGGKITGLYVDPPTAYIKKDTIVVWMSGIDGEEVQIVFNEGKTCRDVTANPNQKLPGFFMDSKNCYVTSFLPYCATSTLQFPEKGAFEYKVVTVGEKMQAKGEIIVKE